MKIDVQVGPPFHRRTIEWPFSTPPRIGETIAYDITVDEGNIEQLHVVKKVEWGIETETVYVVAEPY